MGKEASPCAGLKIKDVPRIFDISDQSFNTDEDVDRCVDLPLRQAVKILFRKNIITCWSTANVEDGRVNGMAMIFIESQCLSGTNKALARNTLGYKGERGERVLIELSITPETPVAEVEQYFVEIAKQFADQ